MERLRAYPWVIATLAVGAVGLALLAAGLDDASRWTVVAWVILVAATQAWDMVRSLRAGDVGLDILAVVAWGAMERVAADNRLRRDILAHNAAVARARAARARQKAAQEALGAELMAGWLADREQLH